MTSSPSMNGRRMKSFVPCWQRYAVAMCLRTLVINSSVVRFAELQSSDQSPVCLFPKHVTCEEFNTAMLNNLPNKFVEIPCTDEVDETSGTCKWSKTAAEKLEKLNKDSNLTAGLEAVLCVAVRARVMLRRNIDTEKGLVSGAIGTVKRIEAGVIAVQFDNIDSEYSVEKVKSKFIVTKKFSVQGWLSPV